MTNESVILRAGPFILHHNGEMLLFAVLGGFWRHFEMKTGDFLTLQVNSNLSTAYLFTMGRRKANEYVLPGAGSNISRDSSQIPHFAANVGFWQDFRGEIVISLGTLNKFSSNDHATIDLDTIQIE